MFGTMTTPTTFSTVVRWSGLSLLLLHLVAATPAAQEAPTPQVAEPDGMTPGTAATVSLLATAVPTALGYASRSPGLTMAGLLVGPATGYWVGGAPDRGWRGVGIRAGATLVGSVVVAAAWGDDWTPSGGATAAGLGFLGVLTYLVVDDISEVDDVIATRNGERAAAARQRASLDLAPVVSPTNGGTAGLVGRLRF